MQKLRRLSRVSIEADGGVTLEDNLNVEGRDAGDVDRSAAGDIAEGAGLDVVLAEELVVEGGLRSSGGGLPVGGVLQAAVQFDQRLSLEGLAIVVNHGNPQRGALMTLQRFRGVRSFGGCVGALRRRHGRQKRGG